MRTVGELRKALKHFTDDTLIMIDSDVKYMEIDTITRISSPNTIQLVIVELKP